MARIGLIGCGNWGKNILRDLLQLGAEVPVADVDPSTRQRALSRGAADVFPVAELLPPCDGYVVAVPIPVLTPVCESMLERRAPIFAEKTLLLSKDDYLKLRNLGGDRFLFAMHKWHYHPGIEALRQISRSGRLGQVKLVNCVRHHWVKDFHGGDVFWTQAIHDLTIVKHILGTIPESISALQVVFNEDGLPVGFEALMGKEPGVSLSVNGAHCYKRSGVTVQGDRGTAGLHDAYDDHILVRTGEGDEEIPIDTTFPLYLELKEFLAYLKGGPEPLCNLDSAWEVSRIILKLREKAGINSLAKENRDG